jgi:PAS domain S-box-containing protein
MKKEKKTRGQLISELAKLRQRIAELERGEAEHTLKERTLRESKELFQKVFVSQPDALFILDANNPPKILDCNPSTTRIFGHSRKEMLGRTTDFLHVDKRRRRKFQEHLHPAIAKQGFFHIPEFEMKRNDGTVLPTEHTVVSLEDDQGKRIGWVSLVRDISEHKQVEDALRESEAIFRNLLEYIPGISVQGYTADGTVRYWNKASEEVYGYTVEETISQNLGDLIIPPDLKPLFKQALELGSKATRSGEFMPPGELMLLHKDGYLVPVYSIHTVVCLENKPTLMFCIDVDLSERKRAEEALRESNETLRAIINASPLAILAIDPHSKVTMWNPAAESIFGWTEQEVLGQYLPLVPPDKSVEHHDLRQRAFRGEKLTGIEAVRQKKDGTSIDVSFSTAPVNDAEGNVMSIMAVLEDITERKRAEESLRESEQRYSSLFKNNHSVMLLIDPESADIVDANPAACSFYGWSQKELTGKKITDINMLTNEQVFQEMERAKSAQRQHFYFRHHLASEKIRDVEVYSGPIMLHGKQLLYSIIHDISKRKQAEEKLRKVHDGLEQRTAELVRLNEKLQQEIEERKQVEQELKKREAELEIRTSELEEVNSALRVLLKRRDEDKTELEEKVLYNVKELVVPYVERLKSGALDAKQTAYVSILESNLHNIVSAFAHKMSSKYLGLTPTEIQIANLVKQGRTTKEIAEILNSSDRTVEFHRKNIRKKIGIVNRKVNLRSHLLSM